MLVIQLFLRYSKYNIMNTIFIAIGYVASFMLSILMLPQIYETYKTKNASGISIWFLIFEVITTCLWVIYGIGFLLEGVFDGIPIVIANSCMLLSSLVLICMKRMYQQQTTA